MVDFAVADDWGHAVVRYYVVEVEVGESPDMTRSDEKYDETSAWLAPHIYLSPEY